MIMCDWHAQASYNIGTVLYPHWYSDMLYKNIDTQTIKEINIFSVFYYFISQEYSYSIAFKILCCGTLVLFP